MSSFGLIHARIIAYGKEYITCTKTRQNPTGCKSPIHFASNANAESKAVEWERSYRVSRQRDHTVEVGGFSKGADLQMIFSLETVKM